MSCLRRFLSWFFIIGFIGFSTPSFSRIGSLFSLDNSLGFGCLRAFSKKYQRERQLLEWGEAQVGRPFTEKEAKAFKRIQQSMDFFLNPLTKYKVLAGAGFLPSERKKLIKAIPLMEPDKEVKVKIPEKTNEEQKLKAQGFNSAYTKGIDEANEWIAVAEQIRVREGTVDPFKTHFDYFANKTLKHIQDIDKKVEDPKQKRKLLIWKKYVENQKLNDSFTYEDFLKVNWALSKILKPQTPFNELEKIENLLHSFPYIIAMPTTIGDVGIMTLNRAGTHGIHALGLKSAWYFGHDLGHAIFTTKYPPIWFYENINRLSEKLPIQKRKNIELAYWVITHENTFGDKWFSSRKNMQTALKACAFTTPHKELKGLIDTSSKEKIKQQLEQAIQHFRDIFVLARRRALWL